MMKVPIFALLICLLFVGSNGYGGMLGGRKEIENVKTNKEVQELGRFSVEEYNRQRGTQKMDGGGELQFLEVVEAQSQVVSGIKYYLKVSAVRNGVHMLFDSEVVPKSGGGGGGLAEALSHSGTMGISRDSMHKRRATGGKKKAWRKKRKYELGRQPANTKLSSNKTVRRIRVRGGNVKWRALRLDTGNFSWGSEAVTRKTRLLDVVYNASNNELVRTQTLVKSAIVQVDAAPFKQWYLQHYGVEIGRRKKSAVAKKDTPEEGEGTTEEAKKSNHVARKLEKRQQGRTLDPHIEEQFGGGRLLACISSRPGQCGRCDGYILEGKELEFYMKKLQRKKGKGAGAAA
ncbi:hypothetical protein DVH24_000849 [Malus domestica]|uniref:40S ribosomal protein S8 n=2 Tax=Malus TaxID=3749 RepID=A0A498K3U3_MALDO|nr:hypothetical protein DVH24_000849 [Malus domestica]